MIFPPNDDNLTGDTGRSSRFERTRPDEVQVPVPEFDPLGALRKMIFDPPISLKEMGRFMDLTFLIPFFVIWCAGMCVEY